MSYPLKQDNVTFRVAKALGRGYDQAPKPFYKSLCLCDRYRDAGVSSRNVTFLFMSKTMPSDVECPYCGAGNRIDECMGEDESCTVECKDCEKEFTAICNVIVFYTSRCADDKHIWEDVPEHPGYHRCTMCDDFEKM